jgi:PIN domain nuclease of toxin-antitoxin system
VTAKTDTRFVLDSFAVLAFLQGEPAGQRVADILAGGDAWMTLVNLGEVIYILERASGKRLADEAFANLYERRPSGEGNMNWIPVDGVLVRRAASLKAAGGMSYADCFAAAAAANLGCPILTGDPEFAAAERAGIEVAWL